MTRILRRTARLLGGLGILGSVIYGAYVTRNSLTDLIDSKNKAVYADLNGDGLRDMVVQTPIKYKVFLQERDGTYSFTQDKNLSERASKLFENK